MKFNELGGFFTKIRKKHEKGSDNLMKKIVLGSLTNVVLATPVREGIARANWNIGIGSRDQTVDDKKTDVNGVNTISKGQSTIQSGNSDTDYVLSNSLPYISSLNKGSSAQAPAGYVEREVESVVKQLTSNTKVLK